MEDVAPSNGVASHHADHRLRQPSDLHLQVEHVQPRHPVGAHVPRFATHALVAAGAERLRAGACQDDDSDRGVLPGIQHAP